MRGTIGMSRQSVTVVTRIANILKRLSLVPDPAVSSSSLASVQSQILSWGNRMNRKERRSAAKRAQISPGQTRGSTTTFNGAAADEAFRAGIWHHQAGRLAEAEQCYRHVLALQPN